jgi:hypothetical protein
VRTSRGRGAWVVGERGPLLAGRTPCEARRVADDDCVGWESCCEGPPDDEEGTPFGCDCEADAIFALELDGTMRFRVAAG